MPEPMYKPTLLERLREQSDALRGQDTAKRRPVEEALSDIDRRLWRSFNWLDEALDLGKAGCLECPKSVADLLG